MNIDIIQLLMYLVIIGVILYVVNTVIPMVAWMRTVINIVAALLVVYWLLQVFGIYPVHLKIR